MLFRQSLCFTRYLSTAGWTLDRCSMKWKVCLICLMVIDSDWVSWKLERYVYNLQIPHVFVLLLQVRGVLCVTSRLKRHHNIGKPIIKTKYSASLLSCPYQDKMLPYTPPINERFHFRQFAIYMQTLCGHLNRPLCPFKVTSWPEVSTWYYKCIL